ncbi:DUF4345 family protein [Adhaeribacter aquaticus]|uniref:DUF4345 family protein n=1 Tax=Adhaeribacter aquaticus TaxID=299567 RepID=UPI0004183BBE|nr:DUF4345 family protein [Adhaeribacter aquaticus]
MKTQKVVKVASQGFILLSALSLLSISVMAFASPQAIMDLVGVKLTSPDAFSSIRGVYGGVGLTLFLLLLYLLRQDLQLGLGFLCLLWGLYALSRIVTIYTEGALGAFGTQWLITESIFFVIAALLLYLSRKIVLSQLAN